MKYLGRILAIFVALLFVTNASAKDASMEAGKTPATIEKTIEGAKAVIGVCSFSTKVNEMSYRLSLEAQRSKAESDLIFEYLAKDIPQKSAREMQIEIRKRVASQDQIPTPAVGVGCENERKQAVMEMAKSVSKSKPKISEKVKDMTAQWLTVMDSIGKPNFADENSKFETLANRLLLE